MNMTDLGIPINTCVSVGSDIENPIIAKAKQYLTDNYKNHYNLSPHITYAICPFPEKNLEALANELDAYFASRGPLQLEISPLHFESNKQFFSLPVVGEEVKKVHVYLVELFNKYRDGCIRQKDIKRIADGERTEEEIQLIKKYGYFRILDKFTPHITIGNVETDSSQIPEIRARLEDLLSEFKSGVITVDRLHLAFHTDAEVQTEMEEIWGKDYLLRD